MKSRLLSCLMWNTELLFTQCRGIGHHLAAREKCHGFSRVAREPGLYFRDMTGMDVFVQRRQDSWLVARDTPGFSLRLGRAIGMAFNVRQETKCPFPVAKGILEFLSIFK